MSRKHPHARVGKSCPCHPVLGAARLSFDNRWRLFIEEHWDTDDQAWLRGMTRWLDRLKL